MKEVFQPYSGPMDFASILSRAQQQREAAASLVELAMNGGVDEQEAKEYVSLIHRASESLRATVAVFLEMHKEAPAGERKTLEHAIVKLDEMAGKFKIGTKLS